MTRWRVKSAWAIRAGRKIDKAAREGDPPCDQFPRGKVAGSRYDFSFSGMKSAVLNYLNTSRMKGITVNVPDVAASFQQAVVDVLVSHAGEAIGQYGLRKFAIAGGKLQPTALCAPA